MSLERGVKVYAEGGDGRTFRLEFRTSGDFTLFKYVKPLSMVYARQLEPELLHKVKEDHARDLSDFDINIDKNSSFKQDIEIKVEALQRACNMVNAS